MKAFSTILLTHTLAAILTHRKETPDLDPDLPGLLEFKNTLLMRVEQLRNEEPTCRQSGTHIVAA